MFCYCCCCFLPFSDTCTRIQSQKHSAHIQNEIILLAFRDAWTINENLQHSTIHSHSVTQTHTHKHGPKIHIQRQRDRGRRTHILIMEKLTNKKKTFFHFYSENGAPTHSDAYRLVYMYAVYMSLFVSAFRKSKNTYTEMSPLMMLLGLPEIPNQPIRNIVDGNCLAWIEILMRITHKIFPKHLIFSFLRKIFLSWL